VGETVILVGRTDAYCKRCIKEELRGFLREYALFDFNCRTVSYLIMTRVLGFDPDLVYAQFQKCRTVCGLNRDECFSIEELHHYVAWRHMRDESVCKMT